MVVLAGVDYADKLLHGCGRAANVVQLTTHMKPVLASENASMPPNSQKDGRIPEQSKATMTAVPSSDIGSQLHPQKRLRYMGNVSLTCNVLHRFLVTLSVAIHSISIGSP